MNDRLAQSQTGLGRSVDGLSPPLAQAAEVVCAFLAETRQEGRNKSYELLVVLASRTRDRILEGRDASFTALNLKEDVAPSAAKEPSGWMSPLWAKLIAAEPEWQEGMADVARRRGLAYLPRLVKEPGSPAHYRLEAAPLAESAHPDTPAPVPPGGVHYTPQAVAAPAAWLSSALKSGVVKWTVGLRWVFAAGMVVLTLLAVAGIGLTFTAGIRATRPPSLADLISLLALGGFVAVLLPIYRFFDDLFDLRIVMAPEALTPISQANVTLELRRPSGHDDVGELAFVRYTALCAKCDATVAVFPGRRDFPGRLVGRCRRSGREHVYSFDHVLRIGLPLR